MRRASGILAAAIAALGVAAFGCGQVGDGEVGRDDVFAAAPTMPLELPAAEAEEVSADLLKKWRTEAPPEMAKWPILYPEGPPDWMTEAVRDVIQDRFVNLTNSRPEAERARNMAHLEALVSKKPNGSRAMERFHRKYVWRGNVVARRQPSTLDETAEILAFKADFLRLLERISRERIDRIKEKVLRRISGGAM